MFTTSNFVPVFRAFNPVYGEIVETTTFRQAYEYARYESRASLDSRCREWRLSRGYRPDEIVIIRVSTGEILAKFPCLADPS